MSGIAMTLVFVLTLGMFAISAVRRWRLLRDLGSETNWIEVYEAPTWTEYVRHNLRLTKADANVSEQLRALHDSDEPPAVRRLIERPPSWLSTVEAPAATIEPH